MKQELLLFLLAVTALFCLALILCGSALAAARMQQIMG